jgi:nicotinamidase-related amidase
VTRDLAALVAPSHTALVIVECQQGVIGELANLPALAEAARAGLVPAVAGLARTARAAGVKVIHATAAHPPGRWGANTNARLFAVAARSPVQLIEGSDAAQPLPEIGVEEGDLVLVRRHGLSPMTGTDLEPLLRNAGVTTVVVAGVSLNIAIPNAAFDAVNAGYQVVIPRDGVVGTPEAYGDQVLEHTLAYVATLTTVAELSATWEG